MQEETLEAEKSQYGVILSPSVRSVVDRFGNESVSSYEIVRALSEIHPEYGAGMAKGLTVSTDAPTDGEQQPMVEWIGRIVGWIQKRQIDVNVLHGRLLIYALTELDPSLSALFSKTGFLRALLNELELRYKNESGYNRSNETEIDGERRRFRAGTFLVDDSPASQDLLRRRPFASYIASRLVAIWKDMETDRTQSSFILHVDGRWGSGKTTLLRFIKAALEARHPGWVVVDFDAWRHQRTNPPWWALRQELYQQGVRSLLRRGRVGRAFRLAISERMWRIGVALKPVLLTSLFFACIVTILTFTLIQITARFSDALNLMELSDWKNLLGITGSVWAIALAMRKTLAPSTQKGTQEFLVNQSRPHSMLRHRFSTTVRQIGYPVAIMVDDLDRCSRESVVKMLEGIQTLFRQSRIIYLVAGDKRWIESSFEAEYREIADIVREPSRSLGTLFISKAFQVSIELPPITNLADYWSRVLERGKQTFTADIVTVPEHIANEMRNAVTQQDIDDLLEHKRVESPEDIQLWAQAAVEREETSELQTELEHVLSGFYPFLDRNPRSMKRFVNLYGISRAAMILSQALYGTDLKNPWEQLALWTIIKTRWPAESEAFRREPALVDRVRDSSGVIPELPNLAPYSRMQLLQVIQGEEVGVSLSTLAVQAFTGRFEKSSLMIE